MSTHLSRYFRERREACRIGFGELARRCGYHNVSKGANRIQKFEARGRSAPTLLGKLALVLGITPAEIQRCLDQDRAERERLAEQPIEPHLVVRLMAGVYTRKSFPAEVQEDRPRMESFAAAIAAAKRMKVVLVLSRTVRVWFNQDGALAGVTEDTFEQSHGPEMMLGGKSFLFDILDDGCEPVRTTDGKW